MIRKIISIDREKCNGCGLCITACHEGAIALEEGKAKLLRDDYCDGLGNCLPVCPAGAITFVAREAAPYTETRPARPAQQVQSRLGQWPVQIQLVPVNAPYFENASLLIAADCTAYAYANFHEAVMAGKITIIGCPKLDRQSNTSGGAAGGYTEKLAAILKANSIKSVTVARMEVPCCAGIAEAAIAALKKSGKMIPWRVLVFSTEGAVLEDSGA